MARELRAKPTRVALGLDDLLPLIPLDMIEVNLCISLHGQVGRASSELKLANITTRPTV